VETRSTYAANRWIILSTVLVGSLVGTLGNSMSNLALPGIMRHYDAQINVAIWVVTIYNLLFAALMPVFGRLGDMFGYRRIFVYGMIGHAISFALAALAPSIGWLIAFRGMAGIFNSPALPAVMGIIARVFPAEERGGAMGVWATVNGAAHGLGPVISGFLIQYFGWPSIFWFNAVLTTIGVLMGFAFIPKDTRRAAGSFDLVGATTLTAAIILFMFNLTQSLEPGFGQGLSLALWAACAALLAAFVVSQLLIRAPFVDLRLFTGRGFAAVTVIAGIQFFCLFGMHLLMPLFLMDLQGRPSGVAGLLIAPLAVTLAVVSPAAGRLSDRVGSRVTCAAGMGLVAVAGLGLALWTPGTAAWQVVGTLVALGLGMGLTQSPAANAVTLVVAPERLGVALGIFNMTRFVFGTLGTTIFGVLLERAGGLAVGVPAFRLDFYVFVAVALGAAVLAFGLPGAPPRPAEASHSLKPDAA
jgi:EmrB/QacA subfamily drug resistance transporter